ncbi:alpha-2C adrenergic receptor-like [Saccostrea cucullata]|uniref:alpha-2C adrenergic receptor-like n=1 Tax=Saccostrea cuccullata TaxID=36930 RepID=UPI002ED179AA
MDLNLLIFLISISVFAIIGVIGNSLIIAVYIKTRRSFFNRTYIVALSIVDLIADLLIAPYTAVFELHLVNSDVICHGMEVIRHTVIGFSNLILILIASERLLMVWKPTKIISERKKIMAILVLLVISIFSGLPSGAIYQVSNKEHNLYHNRTKFNNDTTINKNDFCQYTTDILGDDLSMMYRNFLALMILLEFFILIVVYVLVYVVICRQKMRVRRIGSSSVLKEKQKPKKSETSQTTSSVPNDQSDCNSTDDMGLNLKSQPINNKHNRYDPGKTLNFCFKKNGFPVKCADSETDSGAISVTMTKFTSNKDIHGKQMRTLSFDTDTTGVDSEPEKANGRNDRVCINTEKSTTLRRKRKIRVSKHANYVRKKTWTMLFICTFVYLICWIPFFFEIFNVTSILFLRYFFFLGHATNPIIYSIINVKIRNGIKKLF